MRHWGIIAVALAFLYLLSFSAGLDHPLAAAGPAPEVGSIKVAKSVPSITLDNKLTILLTIRNNGSVPVSGIEIYEYFNPSFTLQGGGTITHPSGSVTLPLAQSNTVTQVQAIIDPPSPNSLQPGQSMTLKYTEVAAGPGDFQVPPDLIWYTYTIASSDIKSSLYSNGITIHIPSQAEKLIFVVYPYILAAATFTVTLTILLWARRQLNLVDKKKFSRT